MALFSIAAPFLGSRRRLVAVRWEDKWLSVEAESRESGVVKVDTRWRRSKHTACPCKADCSKRPSLWSAGVGSRVFRRRAISVWMQCERETSQRLPAGYFLLFLSSSYLFLRKFPNKILRVTHDVSLNSGIVRRCSQLCVRVLLGVRKFSSYPGTNPK